MESVLRYIRARKAAVMSVAILATALIAYVSFSSQREIDISQLYFVTIGAIAWVASRRTALLAAVFTAGLVLVCALIHGNAGPVAVAVESGLTFASFVTATLVVHTVSHMFDELAHLARFDALTATPNALHFQDLLAAEFARAQRYERPLTLAFVDVDDFKDVNDTHGHRVGDEVLRSIAAAVTDEIRSTDVLGRLGGDEFGIILPETTEESALGLLTRVERRVAALARESGWPVSISVGATTLAAAARPEWTAEDLLHRADTLMYRAKSEGKGRVVIERFAPVEQALPESA